VALCLRVKNEILPAPTTYHANGKLLLTGEYLVLHGAKAIALPLNVGQQMAVSIDSERNSILWQAFYQNQVWFSCELDSVDFSVLDATDTEKSATLVRILQAIKSLKPEFSLHPGTSFKTTIEANPEWGLGSSSTLLSLLSQFSGVDPFVLNEMVFQGSGFDIACATADGPILYQRGLRAEPVSLDYPFSDQLFLIYSGRKKKTAAEVSSFLNGKSASEQLVEEASNMSREFMLCRDQDEFNLLIRMHEALISKLIGKMALKSMFFADFKGEVKSLGAWGGDFFLASTNRWSFNEVKKYFENKGLMTAFKWDDLILKR
jgi:mevalonate kinase